MHWVPYRWEVPCNRRAERLDTNSLRCFGPTRAIVAPGCYDLDVIGQELRGGVQVALLDGGQDAGHVGHEGKHTARGRPSQFAGGF